MAEYTSTVELKANTGKLERSMANARKSMDKLSKSTRDVNGRFTSLGSKGTSSLNKLNKSAKATNTTMSALKTTIIGLASGAALVALGSGIANAASKFEILRAQLKTMTGDSKKAEVAFNRLKKFADVTPFDFSESIKGFVKLKALGLVDTIEQGEKALKSYGNTAAAMGKTLEQMVEAVADAATGENERLKEFGIKAKKQGEETAYTFQGVTTVVKNNAKDIQKYLLGIGNVQFAGAMAEQAKGITAAMSNLRTNFSLFLDGIGTGLGIVDAMTAAFNRISKVLDSVIESIKNNTEGFQTFKKVMLGAVAAGVAFFVVFAVSKFKAIVTGVMAITKAMMLNPLFLVGGIAGFAVVQLFEKFGGFTEGFSVAVKRMHVVWSNWIAGLKKNSIVKTVLGGVDSLTSSFKSTVGVAYNYVKNLNWDAAWSMLGTASSAAWGLANGAYEFLEAPVKSAFTYIQGLNWSAAWATLGSATTTAWDVTKGAYEFLEAPIKAAYTYIQGLDWSGMWGTFSTDTTALKGVFSDAYSLIAGPIEKVYKYIADITWTDMWNGLESAIIDVKSWFYKMWDYLVGNSIVPDLVNSIGDWFTTMVGFITTPAKDAYDGITGWFTKMYNKVTGTTVDTVNSVNSTFKDVHGFDTDKEMFDSAKIDKLKASFDNLSISMKAVVISIGAMFGVAAVSMITKFSRSANAMFDTFRNSSTTVTGKQGLVNKIMWGAEGGSRRALGDIKRLRKELNRLTEGKKLVDAADGGKVKGAKVGFFKNAGINRAATMDSVTIQAQMTKTTAKMNALAELDGGRGWFSRMLFGKGGKVGVGAKIGGLFGQVFAGFNKMLGLSSKVVEGIGAGAGKVAAGAGKVAAGAGKVAAGATAAKAAASASTGVAVVAETTSTLAKITKAAGTVMRFLSKIALPLTALIAMFDAWKGWTTAVDTDSDGVVSTFEKYKGAIGSVVEGLSFGLISVEAVSTWMDNMFSGDITQTLNALFTISPLGLLDGFLTKVFVWVGDWLGFDTTGLKEYQANGGISAMLANFVGDAFKSAVSTISGWFTAATTKEDGTRNVFGRLVGFFSDTWSSVISTITGWFTIGDAVAADGKTDTIGEKIGVGLTNAWNNIGTMLTGWFTFELPSFGDLSSFLTKLIADVIAFAKTKIVDVFSFSDGKRDGEGTLKARGPQHRAAGGFIEGAGTGTSDSIPAMLSNGEYVINAKSTRKHRALLESLNKNKFATGGLVGGGSPSAGTAREIQFSGGKFDAVATMAVLNGVLKKGSKELAIFTGHVETLRDSTYYMTEEEVRAEAVAKDLNAYMTAQIKATAETTETIKDLGETTEKVTKKIKNEWGGFGQTLTGDLKDALSRGDFSSIGDAIGSGIRNLTQRVSAKLLDRAFAPLEAGIDKWLLSMDTMEVKGENMFDRLGNVGAQMFGGLGKSFGGLFGGSSSGGGILRAVVGGLGGGIPMGFATGGHVAGKGTGTSDSIPARLSNGEYVIKASQAKKHRSLLDMLNGGGDISQLLKFLVPGSGIMDLFAGMKNGPDGMFSNSTMFGLMPDLPTRAAMERGRGFNALNGGGMGGYAASPEDYARAEERRTSLFDRLLTTKARKDELQQLTTGQRAAYEAGVSQKDSRGRFNNANEVLSNITGGALGVSKKAREANALASMMQGKTTNWTIGGKAIGGVSNSFDTDDARLQNLKTAQAKARAQTADRYGYNQGSFSSLFAGLGGNVQGSYRRATAQNLGARFNYASPNEQGLNQSKSASFGNKANNGTAGRLASGTSQAANRANRAIMNTSTTAAKAAGVQQTFRQTEGGQYVGGFATGGRISGTGSGTSDSLIARVSNGEFVVNAASTKANLDLLTQINGGAGKRAPGSSVPKFATGGQVNTGGQGDAPIYLTLNNNYDVQSAMNPQEFQAMLANNSELSFLSVEKKLRETGRSLYK